ncbi:DUF6064 family protein [Arenibaculum pallidiluteum]|uniref:DUF6064 family protein n=1 Tax=Arenibaculum pallidiluteum TaxID=2812559 RepID=UPI001A971D98|nr:DUF6064 family protein [Arenibaculum pallidiluteum]
MSEWWTYALSDFLLFSPRTYYRLFALHNAALWPAHLLALALGLAGVWMLVRPASWHGRALAAGLAAHWLWVAWTFLLVRYATINWGAGYIAAGFVAEAVLLLVLGALGNRIPPATGPGWTGQGGTDMGWPRALGIGLVLFALLLQPLAGPLAGRALAEAELFGMAPDPTVTATLGVLVAAKRIRWEMLAIPLLWCAISGATLWAMEAPDAVLMPAVGVLSLSAALARSFGGRRGTAAG